MIILGIETSCDETAIAIVEADKRGYQPQHQSKARYGARRGKTQKFKILSNIVSSQVELHKKYGGVWPTLAKREHQKNLVPVLEETLKGANLLVPHLFSKKIGAGQENRKRVNARSRIYSTTLNSILEREPELLRNLFSFLKKYQKPKVDLIAVTVGPGLEPCLWVGINFAKALSCFWDIPITPVNHIKAHILVNLKNQKIKFPALSLIVSGGHTQLILMRGFKNYKTIGETRDDAAGECFDKTARILGLGYPGGPQISKIAEKVKSNKFNIKLPRPMIRQKNYDFSFSGLKTAVLYLHKKQKNKSQQYKKEMAREIQQAIIDVLLKKTIKAARDIKVKTIILGGGVIANKELRKRFKAQTPKSIELLMPEVKLSTDNAVMSAIAAYFEKSKGLREIKAEANLRV